MRRAAVCLGIVVGLGLGCSASKDGGGDPTPLTSPPVGSDGAIDPGYESGPGDDGGLIVDALPPSDATPSCSIDDCDKDGYKISEGDCDDHDGTINPEAYDFEGDSVDNDCDGTKDNPVSSCPPADLSSKDATQFVRSADMCAQHSKTKAGKVYDPLVKVEWWTSKPSGGLGSSIAAGNTHANAEAIVAAFGGNAARFGGSMFGISSGPWGRNDPGERPTASSTSNGGELDTGGFLPPTVANACSAIPLNAKDCAGLTNGTVGGSATSIADYSELRITVQVPSNAQAMLFDFAFFSSEYNEYWNSSYNDAFFALATTKKFASTNVAKDAKGLAITVNSGFFQLCPKPPGPSGIVAPAALANCVGIGGDPATKIFGTLAGTYYDGAGIGSTDDTLMADPPPPASGGKKKYIYGGGSGWLTTKFEVTPGETMTLRFMVMDTTDGILDSSAIVDHLTWEKAPPAIATGSTDRPPR